MLFRIKCSFFLRFCWHELETLLPFKAKESTEVKSSAYLQSDMTYYVACADFFESKSESLLIYPSFILLLDFMKFTLFIVVLQGNTCLLPFKHIIMVLHNGMPIDVCFSCLLWPLFVCLSFFFLYRENKPLPQYLDFPRKLV